MGASLLAVAKYIYYVLWRVIPGNLGIIFTGDTQYPLSESGGHFDFRDKQCGQRCNGVM